MDLTQAERLKDTIKQVLTAKLDSMTLKQRKALMEVNFEAEFNGDEINTTVARCIMADEIDHVLEGYAVLKSKPFLIMISIKALAKNRSAVRVRFMQECLK